MTGDVDLPAEALPQQRVSNDLQIRGTFRRGDVYGAATDHRGIGEKVDHPWKHQPIGLFRQFHGISQRSYILGIERDLRVRFNSADRDEDDVRSEEHTSELQ